jgi:predicted NAD/FAD-binding protein
VLTRPQWRTVEGGSRAYVEKIAAPFADRIKLNARVVEVRRTPAGVLVRDAHGRQARYDAVVVAAHANEALAMLAEPTAAEREVLGAFRYSRNLAVLHEDATLMPRRRGAWSAWNHIGVRGDTHGFCVTYWMNSLQGLNTDRQLFVTLNPCRVIAPDKIVRTDTYDHPLFDGPALTAQKRLWSLQGEGGVWFCGAHFGAGFHEDGLQAGLAVAEAVGAARRPWRVADESGRIHLGPAEPAPASLAA